VCGSVCLLDKHKAQSTAIKQSYLKLQQKNSAKKRRKTSIYNLPQASVKMVLVSADLLELFASTVSNLCSTYDIRGLRERDPAPSALTSSSTSPPGTVRRRTCSSSPRVAGSSRRLCDLGFLQPFLQERTYSQAAAVGGSTSMSLPFSFTSRLFWEGTSSQMFTPVRS